MTIIRIIISRLIGNNKSFSTYHYDKTIGSIALDGKDEYIIGHGIWVKDTFKWKPQSSKPPYLSSDKKYTIIQEQFNLGFQKDLVWLKFTEDGHEGLNLLMVDDRILASAKLY